MSEDAEEGVAASDAEVERLEDKRKNRTIRFSGAEWEEVRLAALVNGTPTAEFVRNSVLAIARHPGNIVFDAVGGSLAPLIERIFRYSWFLATERRDAMMRDGRGDEVESLIAEGRALHHKLRRSSSG